MAPRVLLLALAVLLVGAAPAGARWSPPDRVPDSSGFGVPYDIAINPGGRIAVAFPRGGIRVAIRRPHGGWEPTAEVSRTSAAVASPSVVMDAHGRITVAWLEARSNRPPFSGPYKIRGATGDGSGRWGRPVTLGESNHFELAEPQLATNGRGDAAVAWRGLRKEDPSGSTEAVFLAYRRAGHKFQKGKPILEPLRKRRVYDHKVALDAEGRVHVVWTTSEGPAIRYALRRTDGTFGRLRLLSGTPASRPQLAVAGDGAVIVSWREADLDSEGEGLNYGPPWAILRRPSGTWAKAQRLSTVPIYTPLVAASAFGRALVAWAPPPNPDAAGSPIPTCATRRATAAARCCPSTRSPASPPAPSRSRPRAASGCCRTAPPSSSPPATAGSWRPSCAGAARSARCARSRPRRPAARRHRRPAARGGLPRRGPR